ncbi:cytochrome c-type heme lyase [Fragilaria crotonensis]|nr:cytochrome c-type heme lyase [Fragilaria crotonensis]
MGSVGSKPESPPAVVTETANGNVNGNGTEATVTPSAQGGCPVKHTPRANVSQSSQCPVSKSKTTNQKVQQGPVYNVYSQPIDDTNQMPSIANQLPAPQQTIPLSTERVKSSIPKGNAEEETWTYPSPQMFYNALVRKGKLGDTTESDVESVVALHNNMNEYTWRQVLAWEKLAGEEDPKLLKFIGKPSDLSPKASLKHFLLFHPLPFDRHDWTIQRRDGTTVRYVIDYYHDESKSSDEPGSGMPSLTQRVPSLLVDVRPAIDGPNSLLQRVLHMPRALFTGETDFEPLPLKPSESLKSTVAESLHVWDNIQKNAVEQKSHNNISLKEATALASTMNKAVQECRSAQDRLAKCTDTVSCQHASLDLTRCLGKLWCPLQHDTLLAALTAESTQDDGDAIEVALERLSLCVGASHQRAAQARKEYPSIFGEKPEAVN